MKRAHQVAVLTLVAIYAVASSLLTAANRGWYDALETPPFQPPDLVFALIWPLNFVLIVVCGVLYCQQARPASARVFVGSLAVGIAAALVWAWCFYQAHWLISAALFLLLAATASWLLVLIAARSHALLGVGLAVHATWLSLATALAFSYAYLN
ncbi:membrane hypothetical protein [metagenome]|uniref:Tryptophan-rich sensory protein n=1 Tax=metagenome TaxID=256318 RepID=A0A2P2BXX5_9ZZZZ